MILAGDAVGLSGYLSELLAEGARGKGVSSESTTLSPLDVEKGLPLEGWRTPDFFVRYRVFVLPEERDLKKDAKADLAAWAADPVEGVTVVAPAQKRDGYSSLRAMQGTAVVSPRGGKEVVDALARVASRQASNAGVTFSLGGAAFLVDWVGGDMTRVREEVEKLILFAGKGGTAGEDEVREVCIARNGADPFRVARAVLDGDRDAFISAFRTYASGAATEDYHSLAGAIGWEYRRRGKGGGGTLSPVKGERVARALWEIDRGMKGESGLSPGQYLEIRLLTLFR